MNSPVVSLSAAHAEITLEGCSLAQSAISYAIDGLINSSSAAIQGVRECEEKLDELDRDLDESLVRQITQVTPALAREMLASMKVMIDLERVGDLIASFAERSWIVRNRIDMEDVEQLARMASLLETMLAEIRHVFIDRNLDRALRVLRADSEIDRLRNLLLVRHTEDPEGIRGQQSFHVVSMANALERAGDHVKNMAEEMCHLITGHSIRHLRCLHEKPAEQLFIDLLAKQHLGK